MRARAKFVYYAPNFEDIEEAYWVGPVRPCVRASVRGSDFAYGQERLETGSWNLIYRISMKKEDPYFSLFRQTFRCRVMPPFRRVFYFTIISLWNIVNKISGKPLELGSCYLAHRLCPRCRWPCKFYKYLTESSPFSDFGISYSKAILATKYLENRLSQDNGINHTV